MLTLYPTQANLFQFRLINLHRKCIIDFTRQLITFLVILSKFTVRMYTLKTRVVLKEEVSSNHDDDDDNNNYNDSDDFSNNDTKNIMIMTL